jgi:hypothetical protein
MVIRKVRGRQEWRLYTRKPDARTGRHRVLGTFASREAAMRRERQIQFFKHRKG